MELWERGKDKIKVIANAMGGIPSERTAQITMVLTDVSRRIPESAMTRFLVTEGPKLLGAVVMATQTPLAKEVLIRTTEADLAKNYDFFVSNPTDRVHGLIIVRDKNTNAVQCLIGNIKQKEDDVNLSGVKSPAFILDNAIYISAINADADLVNSSSPLSVHKYTERDKDKGEVESTNTNVHMGLVMTPELLALNSDPSTFEDTLENARETMTKQAGTLMVPATANLIITETNETTYATLFPFAEGNVSNPDGTGAGRITALGIKLFKVEPLDEKLADAIEVPSNGIFGTSRAVLRGRISRTPETSTSVLSSETVQSAQEYFGDAFEITPDGKVIDKTLGKEIQGFTIVPFNEQTMIPPYKKEVSWGWQRTYEFEGKTDFTVVGTEADVTVAEDGSLDMYAWEYKEGEFKRQNIEFAAPNGGTVEIEGFSPQEVQHMIINNSSDNPNYRINSFETARSLGTKIPNKIINREVYFTHKGMLEKRSAINYFINNFIPIVDNSGKWSAVDTTCFFVGASFKDRTKALVVWMDQNDNPVIVAMEGKYLEMPGYFNPYWKNHDIKDPFNP